MPWITQVFRHCKKLFHCYDVFLFKVVELDLLFVQIFKKKLITINFVSASVT